MSRSEKEEDLFDVLMSFKIDSKPTYWVRYGNGHINKTYEVKTEKGGHYILQKINNYIFKNVDMLMKNIDYVTSYLTQKGDESLELVKTKNDEIYLNNNGDFYRLYIFVPNSATFEKIDADSPLIKEASEAYGNLHRSLSAIDASKLGEVLPDFHNTQKRFENFLEALKINHKNRKVDCENEINDLIKYKEHYNKLIECIKKKEINLTVTHNDPKINNILFDKDTLKFRCVIDLDTVMPGSILYDFGDALRSLFTGDNECSKDLSKLKVNFKIYKEYLFGYVSKMIDVLTPKEIELLPFSVFLITMELGIRFLDDYLRGDVYYPVYNPDDNLTRARTQITLAKDIYNNLDSLNKIRDEIIEEIKRNK